MRGLALRLSLITAVGLAFVVLALIGAIEADRRADLRASGQRLPWPNQIVGIVELIESASPEQLPLVLRALSSGVMTVHVVPVPPPADRAVAMPGATRLLRSYFHDLGRRSVSVTFDAPKGERAHLRSYAGTMFSSRPVRLVVGLNDGRYAVIHVRAVRPRQLLGLRLSLIVLGITIVIGAATLFAVRQELRPLNKLAAAVDTFGTRLEATAIPEEGPPEVRQLIKAFSTLQERIRALVAGRTRMIAAIGHDFGTYLTRLRLRTEFIADAEQRERANRDIEDMHALVSDALLLARLDADTEPAEVIDLSALVRRHADGFTASGAPVRLDAPEYPLMVRVKPSAMGRAFNNLVSNALRYGVRADVTLRKSGRFAELLVEDLGPGIPASERERVLEPFYRRDQARNLDSAGSGLGLSIVADVVRRSEGSLSLEDRPGGGLSVRIRLPLSEAT